MLNLINNFTKLQIYAYQFVPLDQFQMKEKSIFWPTVSFTENNQYNPINFSKLKLNNVLLQFQS